MCNNTLYAPFDAVCEHCGAPVQPKDAPHLDNTIPSSITKEIPIVFWCRSCMQITQYTYRIPRLLDITTQNLLYYISNMINGEPELLDTSITFNPLNVLEKGIAWALADLSSKNMIYDLNNGFTFKLTLLGKLTLWHGVY